MTTQRQRLTVIYSAERVIPQVTRRTVGTISQLVLRVGWGDSRHVYATVAPLLDDGEAKWVRAAFGIDKETT